MANVTVALDNKDIVSLPGNNYGGFTHQAVIDLTEFDLSAASGASDAVTVTMGSTGTDWLVSKVAVDRVTAVSGTAGTLTVQVGTVTDPNAFVVATDAKTAGPIAVATTPITPANAAGATAETLAATFTNSTSGSPSAITAGKVLVLFSLINLDEYDSNVSVDSKRTTV